MTTFFDWMFESCSRPGQSLLLMLTKDTLTPKIKSALREMNPILDTVATVHNADTRIGDP